MSIYKLYGTGVTDNIASLDIVADGVIKAVAIALESDIDADLETSRVEVSFSSSSGFTANDTKSSFATARLSCSDTGTAASNKLNSANIFMGNINVPVKQGERIYLHGAGTSVTACTVYLYVEDRIGAGRQGGRRVRL